MAYTASKLAPLRLSYCSSPLLLLTVPPTATSPRSSAAPQACPRGLHPRLPNCNTAPLSCCLRDSHHHRSQPGRRALSTPAPCRRDCGSCAARAAWGICTRGARRQYLCMWVAGIKCPCTLGGYCCEALHTLWHPNVEGCKEPSAANGAACDASDPLPSTPPRLPHLQPIQRTDPSGVGADRCVAHTRAFQALRLCWRDSAGEQSVRNTHLAQPRHGAASKLPLHRESCWRRFECGRVVLSGQRAVSGVPLKAFRETRCEGARCINWGKIAAAQRLFAAFFANSIKV